MIRTRVVGTATSRPPSKEIISMVAGCMIVKGQIRIFVADSELKAKGVVLR